MRQTALLVSLDRRRGVRADVTARPRDSRRLGRLPRAGLRGRACGARGARHHLRLPAGCGHSLRSALLHHRRRDSLRRRAGAGDPRDGRAPRARRRVRRLLEGCAEREQHEPARDEDGGRRERRVLRPAARREPRDRVPAERRDRHPVHALARRAPGACGAEQEIEAAKQHADDAERPERVAAADERLDPGDERPRSRRRRGCG